MTATEPAPERVKAPVEDKSYPGAAVDVRSSLYSFSFLPNPDRTEVLAGQAELWDHLRTAAREHGVLDHVRLGTELLGGEWDEAAQRWNLQTSRGELSAQFLVSAMGPLSTPSVPDIPGLASFGGHVFHSARWDHAHDLTGERVGVIGTGSSAAQFVPEIAEVTGSLAVFQRTSHWTFPRLDRRITEVERRAHRRLPALQRLVRYRQFRYHELVLGAAVQHPVLTEKVSRLRLRAVVRTRRPGESSRRATGWAARGSSSTTRSCPRSTGRTSSRVCDAIAEVTPTGVRTVDGTERALGTLILGTGFEVMPVADPLRGRAGDTLTDRRAAHLGTSVHGFPDGFMLVGPNTATGHAPILLYAEPQIEYVLQVLQHADPHGIGSYEVRQSAQDALDAGIRARPAKTIRPTGGCTSWYLNERDGTWVLWPGLTWPIRRAIERFDHQNDEMRRA